MTISNKRVINLSVQISKDLAFRYNAVKLFEELDKIDGPEVTFDFSGVESISRSFAHQYLIDKKLSRKKISEINKTVNIDRMFRIVENSKNKKKIRFDTSSWKIIDYSGL